MVIAFLFESSWLPTQLKENTKVRNEARSNMHRLDFHNLFSKNGFFFSKSKY